MAKFAVSSVVLAVCSHAQDVFLPARRLVESQGAVVVESSLTCPVGFEQVGNLGADIQGCGLEECDSRYQVPTLYACGQQCLYSLRGCKAFTWSPLGGDNDHLDKKVCTMYGTTEANQVWGPNQILCKEVRMPLCPRGWVPAGELNDVQGCGLESCDSRYAIHSPEECSQRCDALNTCESFSWAPLGSDTDHPSVSVCTLYGVSEPTQMWGHKQIMCKREGLTIPELHCPRGWVQVGAGFGGDIKGCGLEGCDGRYTVPTADACSLKCLWSGLGCKSFTWAPMGGDRDHPDQNVCTIYGTDVADQMWVPNQILCKMA